MRVLIKSIDIEAYTTRYDSINFTLLYHIHIILKRYVYNSALLRSVRVIRTELGVVFSETGTV